MVEPPAYPSESIGVRFHSRPAPPTRSAEKPTALGRNFRLGPAPFNPDHLQTVLLPTTPYSATDGGFSSNLRIACIGSLALHLLAIVVTDQRTAFTALPHRAANGAVIALQLPNTSARSSQEDRLQPIKTRYLPAPRVSETIVNPHSDPAASGLSDSHFPSPALATAYYHRTALTTPARPLEEPDFPQPVEQLEGAAELTLLVGEDGQVDAVLAGTSTLPPEYLSRIEEYILKMEFQPGVRNGEPVKSRLKIEISTTYAPEIIESKREFTSDPSNAN